MEYSSSARGVFEDWSRAWEATGDRSVLWQPLWARTSEKAAKLALIHATSRGVDDLKITEADVTWACEVADYCSRLFQRKGFASIADSEFERNCKSTVESIKRYASHSTGQVSHRLLTSRAPLKRLGRQGRTDVLMYLQETGMVTRSVNQHGGVVYELAETKKPASREDD